MVVAGGAAASPRHPLAFQDSRLKVVHFPIVHPKEKRMTEVLKELIRRHGLRGVLNSVADAAETMLLTGEPVPYDDALEPIDEDDVAVAVNNIRKEDLF